MLIRLTALLALALSACGFQYSESTPDAAPALAELEQAISNTCDPVNYPCDPLDRFANGVCQRICGGGGYCLKYSAIEYAWCAAHPGKGFGPGKRCSRDGDPLWQTHCEPGFLP